MKAVTELETDVALFYILSQRDTVTSEELFKIGTRLQANVPGVMIDTTFLAVQEAVRDHGTLFTLSGSHNSYTVSKLNVDSMFFNLSFLDRCYAPLFKDTDFQKIKSVLTRSH